MEYHVSFREAKECLPPILHFSIQYFAKTSYVYIPLNQWDVFHFVNFGHHPMEGCNDEMMLRYVYTIY